ncbi:unnamed protein product [Schistosoma spindalis]|nr:unnamed protein product [Schistosoma spindale]
MRISLNQNNPVVNRSFEEINGQHIVKPKFPLKYYDSDVDYLDIHYFGQIYIFKTAALGYVSILAYYEMFANFEVLNSDVTGKTTGLIYPSGKISIYFEDIPTTFTEKDLYSDFFGEFKCEGTICAKHNSSKACQTASTSNMICIWCAKANTCIESNDQNTHQFKVNDCGVEKGEENLKENTEDTDQYSVRPDVSVLSTPTANKHIETSSGNTEVQVEENLKESTQDTDQYLTIKNQINEEKNKNKSFQYLYLVIPLIVSFFVVCIGFAIGGWFYWKKKTNE